MPKHTNTVHEKVSMINHCCEANCMRFNVRDTMVIYAIYDIKEGEEVVMNYTKETDYHQRQKTLKMNNINCNCVFCQEQLYQIQHKKEKPKGKSRHLKFIKEAMTPKQNFKSLYKDNYDLTNVAGIITLGQGE